MKSWFGAHAQYWAYGWNTDARMNGASWLAHTRGIKPERHGAVLKKYLFTVFKSILDCFVTKGYGWYIQVSPVLNPTSQSLTHSLESVQLFALKIAAKCFASLIPDISASYSLFPLITQHFCSKLVGSHQIYSPLLLLSLILTQNFSSPSLPYIILSLLNLSFIKVMKTFQGNEQLCRNDNG